MQGRMQGCKKCFQVNHNAMYAVHPPSMYVPATYMEINKGNFWDVRKQRKQGKMAGRAD